MRRLPLIGAALACLGLVGCGTSASGSCDAPSNPAVFELGTGEACFERLTPGQTRCNRRRVSRRRRRPSAARFAQQSAGGAEIVTLDEGAATFAVRPLATGEPAKIAAKR
ncbi:MAG: hypothetical protein ACMG6S_11800 [Byssovorax sp.]